MSPPLEGAIAPGVFPPLLRRLHTEHRTGLLNVSRGSERGSVCFVRGQIAWGQSSNEECHLGPVLVRHGFVAQEALDQVVDLVGGGKRLGELLLEFGSLDREALDEALAIQVRETLLSFFAWQEGAWRFEDHPAEFFKGYDRPLRISTGDLILDAVWSIPDLEVVRFGLGDLDRVVSLTTDPILRYQPLALGPEDHLLLSLVDGIRSAGDVLTLMPADPHEVLRRLFGLLCTGTIEMIEPEAAAPEPAEEPPTREEVLRLHAGLATRDHFEVLGLLRAAPVEKAVEAWRRLTARYGGAAQSDPALAALRPQLASIVERLNQAAHVLGDPRRRGAYESALAAAEVHSELLTARPSAEPAPPGRSVAELDFGAAEEVLAHAEGELAEGRAWDALQAVEAVLDGLAGRSRLRALLLRARVYARNPRWLKEAEEQLKEILAASPTNVDALFLLGQVYKAAGFEARATAVFRRVLDLRPRHAGALEETRGASSPA
jgi:tetratricopeptide (TPR) repeat protein